MDGFSNEPIFVTRPLLPELQNVSQRLSKVWESKWITNNGLAHQQLKAELRAYLEVDNLSLFSNGTLALILGLKSMDLTGEVITTPFTFPATVQALDWNGLTPIFCDIEPETLTIDATKIEALITEKTSAILGVHVFGNPCDVEKIDEIAKKHNLKVIYDGAHAFGAKIKDKPVGDYGDMTMFSFHATKLFNTIEGGALTYKEPRLADKLYHLKNFGLKNPEEVVLSGLNAKLNEVQAVIGLETLKMVSDERIKRHNIKKTYEEYLAEIPGIRLLTTLENEFCSYQYLVIEVDESSYGRSRNWIYEKLQQHNIFPRKYFYPLCSHFSWYSDQNNALAANLPQAEKSVDEVLAMPYYGELELTSVIRICEILKEYAIKNRSVAI